MPSSPFALLDGWRAPAPEPSRVAFLSATPFAHRGLHDAVRVENSLAAADAALAIGHGIECDVQASRDDEAFVFHDAELDRLTEASGTLRDRPARAIDKIRLKGSDEPIPTLHALLIRILGKVPLLIEVKAPGRHVAALCLSVRRDLEGYRGPVAVMSFNPEVSRWFALHAPHVVRGLVVTEAGKLHARGRIERHIALWRARPEFLAYDVRDLPSRFAAAQRRRGLPVLTWTVRDAKTETVALAQADQIIYEHPRWSEIVARMAESVSSVPAAEWDACAGEANPFVGHAFLSALEESGSAIDRTGWQPLPIIIDGADGRPAGILPAYAKSHSQGEYVFDHAWANALERAGGHYYPKLQIAVPFSPVPGPRLLLRDPAVAPALIAAAEAVTRCHDLSSAHATFIAPEQVPLFEAAGWLIRTDRQFHWSNDGYAGFDDFLAALASRKRKAIRKERAAAVGGLEIVHLTGAAIEERHWQAFWQFYQDTGARKWGRPYLTRKFFTLLGQRMADKVLLILALRNGQPIAGALNLIGADTLYGRYWGTTEEVPFLHFEICYYQAIDAAIALGLKHVEAGAQGEHKLARGYVPTPTYSAHFLVDDGFRRAVADYLRRERAAVEAEIEGLTEMAPFKRGG